MRLRIGQIDLIAEVEFAFVRGNLQPVLMLLKNELFSRKALKIINKDWHTRNYPNLTWI